MKSRCTLSPLIAFAIVALAGCGHISGNDSEEPMTQHADADQWDFYFCNVDDLPASIFINFKYSGAAHSESAEQLYWCLIQILEPGDNGLGVGEDSVALTALEDEITGNSKRAGFHFVGRLRNDGAWQLCFYGRPGLEGDLQDIADRAIPESSGREFEVGSKPDPDWSYYRDFLYPNDERLRWIQDRRVVEQLEDSGDPLKQPRRVDHWAYFRSAIERDKFIDAVKAEGFEVEKAAQVDSSDMPYSAQIFRIDSVQLNPIHAVVMSLVRSAIEFGGEYDGWETSVEIPN